MRTQVKYGSERYILNVETKTKDTTEYIDNVLIISIFSIFKL